MNIIECKGLAYAYPNGSKALKNIDFYVKKGEVVSILGGNGAGKTTLLQHFNGILWPSVGKVFVDGEKITKKNVKAIRRKVGFVFQNPDDQLFSPTVWEDVAFGPMNLGLSPRQVQKRVEWSLRTVGAHDFASRSPHHLSYGQKKRVCIAGALAMRPDILVFDEPTAALDPQGIRSLVRLIKNLNEKLGTTIVMATHELSAVPEISDRIYVLNQGRVVCEGAPVQVFSQSVTLHKANLDMPDATRLMNKLRKDGHDVGPALTVDEAYASIRKLLEGGRQGNQQGKREGGKRHGR